MTETAVPIIRRVDRGRNKDRHYLVDGVPELAGLELPSVTTVLGVINKPALIPWATNTALESVRGVLAGFDPKVPVALGEELIEQIIANARKRPNEVKDEAADLGTRAHIYIEALLQGGALPECTDDIKPCVDAFWAWYEQTGLDVDVSERMVYSVKHRYAGALDGMGRNKGGQKIVMDWKTSRAIYMPEYGMQVAAYAMADEEMTGERVEEAIIVRFPKVAPQAGEAPFEVKHLDRAAIERCFGYFLHARGLWEGMRNG